MVCFFVPDPTNKLFRFRVKQSQIVDFMLQPAHAITTLIFEDHGGRRGKKD